MEEYNELNRTLGLILGELKGINAQLANNDERHEKLEIRVALIEKFKNESIGKIAVLGLGFSAACWIMGAWISKKLGL